MRHLIICFLLATTLLSCSKTDWFENNQPEINFFAVPKEATGEAADLRRDFFDATSVYLLFSDTLGIRETPTLSGEMAADLQILDFWYNMNPKDAFLDSLEFIPFQNATERREATLFLQDEIFGELPEMFYPYSVLLLERMLRYENYYGISYNPGVDILTFPSLQCMAIAVGNVAELSDIQKERLSLDITCALVVSRLSLIPEEEFSTFYSYSESYYGQYSWNIPTPVQSVGFLEGYSDYDRSTDKSAFIEKVFELTEEEFRATYGAYDLVIAKMEEIVKILNEYGVKIYQ